jgi:hypothetical protein
MFYGVNEHVSRSLFGKDVTMMFHKPSSSHALRIAPAFRRQDSGPFRIFLSFLGENNLRKQLLWYLKP